MGLHLELMIFGKSAPYKKIYEHFNLTSEYIIKKLIKFIN